MKGYMGKVLFVDLATREITEEDVPDKVYENLLSGVGLGAYYLYNRIPAGADPLGPDNILGLVSGMLTGVAGLMTGRWMAVCKSPLTGGWGDANCGGSLAPAIKQCGYDGIFFKGISPEPVYLHLDDEGAELRDASHVWGKDAVEAESILTEECKKKKKPQVAVIGQAGENKSLIAGITNASGRIAARSGVGAVMGSKLLKAVVLSGTRKVEFQDTEVPEVFFDTLDGENLLLEGPAAELLPTVGDSPLVAAGGVDLPDPSRVAVGGGPEFHAPMDTAKVELPHEGISAQRLRNGKAVRHVAQPSPGEA